MNDKLKTEGIAMAVKAEGTRIYRDIFNQVDTRVTRESIRVMREHLDRLEAELG